MATFNLEKGASFNLAKGMETVHCFGLGHANGDSSLPYLVEDGAYALTWA